MNIFIVCFQYTGRSIKVLLSSERRYTYFLKIETQKKKAAYFTAFTCLTGDSF